jgi:flagellar operon protein
MIDAIRRLPPMPGIAGVNPAAGAGAALPTPQTNGASFADLLDQSLTTPLNFSAHAQSRLSSRSIQLSSQQIARLESGVEQAAQKGARDSLIMMDNLAFIVSVKNRTVVTALDGATRTGNVFTQIDSAVIV